MDKIYYLKCKGRMWIELNKCYSEGAGVSVEAYVEKAEAENLFNQLKYMEVSCG